MAADHRTGSVPVGVEPEVAERRRAHPASAICWMSGLSSISTSGSVFDDACCSTFWISVGPGTDWWSTLATPDRGPALLQLVVDLWTCPARHV